MRSWQARVRCLSWFINGVAAISLSCLSATSAAAQTSLPNWLELSGFYQFVTELNTGHINPNDVGLLNGKGSPDLNLMSQMIDLRARGEFGDHFSFFLEPRLWNDLTNAADSRWPAYEAMPADYRGDGYLMRVGGNNFKAELWNAYFDYRSGNFLLRVGKQTIAWGQDIALRVLDQINPLDLSQAFLFGLASEEFDQIRIPEWMARLDYALPNSLIPDLAVQLFGSPGTWTPAILPAQGAPFNVLPAILLFREDVHQGKAIAGGQLSGTIAGASLTLNFLTRPTEAPVGIADGLVAIAHGGAPLLLPCCGIPTLFRVLLEGKHPRFYMAGWSLAVPWPEVGGVFRLESTVVPDLALVKNNKIVDRPQIQSMFAVDRPIYWGPEAALEVTFQYLETDIAGDLHYLKSNGVDVPNAVHDFAIFLSQPFFNKSMAIDFLGLADAKEGWWLQPILHYEYGNNWRFDAWYNAVGGAKSSRFPGSFWWVDGPGFRIIYGLSL